MMQKIADMTGVPLEKAHPHSLRHLFAPLREVCDSEYLEVLVNHVIDYVESSYDVEKKACCYEIHLKKLSETARGWAESMDFL